MNVLLWDGISPCTMRFSIGVEKSNRKDLNIGSDAIVSAVELLENYGVKIIEIDYDNKFSGTWEYGISVDALMAKAVQLNIITNSRYTSCYKKKNAIPSFKEAVEKSLYPMEHTNRFKRLIYCALASEVISFSKAAGLLDLPFSEVRDTLNLM